MLGHLSALEERRVLERVNSRAKALQIVPFELWSKAEGMFRLEKRIGEVQIRSGKQVVCSPLRL